jgi:hypothetical protein
MEKRINTAIVKRVLLSGPPSTPQGIIKNMTPDRRTILTAATGLLAGCVGLESDSTPTEQTSTETPERTDTPADTPAPGYRLEDLRLTNLGDEDRTLSVRFVPDSGKDATLELSILVPHGEGVIWENVPALDEAGQVTASVETGGGETLEDDLDWHGDTVDDNRRIVVRFDDEDIEVEDHVA